MHNNKNKIADSEDYSQKDLSTTLDSSGQEPAHSSNEASDSLGQEPAHSSTETLDYDNRNYHSRRYVDVDTFSRGWREQEENLAPGPYEVVPNITAVNEDGSVAEEAASPKPSPPPLTIKNHHEVPLLW